MPNLTVYYPDEEERNGAKDELAGIAASFGYYTIHESAERGNIRALLGAIIGGEMALVLLPDEGRIAAINELRRLADSSDVDWIARDAFRDIASALVEARNREERD
jgi:hypothetical protein